MLTRRGFAVIGAAIGLFVGGRILGTSELWILATAALVLVGLDALRVATRAIAFEVRRAPDPSRLHVGSDGTIDLELTHRGRRLTPVLAVHDLFDDGRQAAQFLVPGMRPGETRHAAYRIPTGRRGRFRVGPFEASVLDAFGLVRRRVRLLAAETIVVYPRVHPLLGLTARFGPDHRTDTSRTVHRSLGGDDFLTLRAYVVGDDLRRVHWASTARVGELMVRQDEAPWQAPPVVVLDERASVHTPASFERAVEAVASLVVMFEQRQVPFEAVRSSGHPLDPGWGLDAVLEQLAVIEPDAGNRLALPALGRSTSAAAIVVTGWPEASTFAALAALTGPGRGRVMLIATATGGSAEIGPIPRGITVIDASGVAFTDAWEQGVRAWTRSGAPV